MGIDTSPLLRRPYTKAGKTREDAKLWVKPTSIVYFSWWKWRAHTRGVTNLGIDTSPLLRRPYTKAGNTREDAKLWVKPTSIVYFSWWKCGSVDKVIPTLERVF